MRFRVSLVLALAMLAICCTSAFAAPEPFSMTYGNESGSWVYRLFNNDISGDVIIWGLDIYWDPAVPTDYYTITGTPAGWAFNPAYGLPGWDAIENDPGPGESLKGFAFTAATPAPLFTVYYNVLGNDCTFEGTAVPEPGSLLALLGGVGSLCGMMIRRRIA